MKLLAGYVDDEILFFPSYHRKRMKNNRKTARSKTV